MLDVAELRICKNVSGEQAASRAGTDMDEVSTSATDHEEPMAFARVSEVGHVFRWLPTGTAAVEVMLQHIGQSALPCRTGILHPVHCDQEAAYVAVERSRTYASHRPADARRSPGAVGAASLPDAGGCGPTTCSPSSLRNTPGRPASGALMVCT